MSTSQTPTVLVRFLRWGGPPLVLFVLMVGTWHLATTWGKIPTYLVPSPTRVATSVWEHRRELWVALLRTGSAAGLGFLSSIVAGFVVSLIFSQSAWIRRSCYPYAIFLQTVPVVAVAPLIINWFGFGFQSVVLVSFMISLFPIITNGTTGLLAIEPRYLELFAICNASRWQVLWKLRVPNAVPALVTGAKVASGLSVIGAVVGEFFVGFGNDAQGLGYLITLTSGQLKTDYLFAAVLCCTVLGLTVFAVVNLSAAWLLRRWQGPEN